jgi:hypothetical protein
MEPELFCTAPYDFDRKPLALGTQRAHTPFMLNAIAVLPVESQMYLAVFALAAGCMVSKVLRTVFNY